MTGLIDILHPWTSFVIVPLFALANAGVEIHGDALASPSAVFVGVLLGLVVGKLVGITAFSWLAVRLGLGRLPGGARWGHIVGVGAVAGIGFTVSLFVTGLAFDDVALQDDAKLGDAHRLRRRRPRRLGRVQLVAAAINRTDERLAAGVNSSRARR